VAKEIQEWLGRACVRTLYIQKASPWENGYVESFNVRLRDELRDRKLFLSLTEAQVVLDQWRNDYNHRRPHGSLGFQTPAGFAAACAASASAKASAPAARAAVCLGQTNPEPSYPLVQEIQAGQGHVEMCE
jgi:putative transposase